MRYSGAERMGGRVGGGSAAGGVAGLLVTLWSVQIMNHALPQGLLPVSEVAFSPDEGGEALVVKVIDSAKSELRVLSYSFTSAPVTAALLRAKSCGGCMLDIDNAELATIRAAADDDVIRCEECSRILVRTSESGI